MIGAAVRVGLVLALFWPAAASACRCARVSEATAFRAADIIVVAVVEDEQRVNPYDVNYRLRVRESLKSRVPNAITLEGRTNCQPNLILGQSYLLYLRSSPARRFATSICAGNLPLDRADARIAAIRARVRRR